MIKTEVTSLGKFTTIKSGNAMPKKLYTPYFPQNTIQLAFSNCSFKFNKSTDNLVYTETRIRRERCR